MQQLTLPFDGFVQTGQNIDAKTPAREVQVIDKAAVARVTDRAKAWLLGRKEQLEDCAMCAAIMAGGIVVLYLAAVLQGGAV